MIRVIVVIVLVVGGLMAVQETWFAATAEGATATVTSVSGAPASCGHGRRRRACTEFTAELSFRTPDGQAHTLSTPAGKVDGTDRSGDHASLSVGEEVAVVYDADDPTDARRDRWFELHRDSVVLLSVAAVVGLVSLLPRGVGRRYRVGAMV